MAADPITRRVGSLVVARLVAQGVSFAWVLLAARSLTRTELGALGVGLTALFVTSAMAELGTTRTVVRHCWVGADALRPTLVAAVRWRLVGGVVVGALVVGAADAANVAAPSAVVLVAVVVSATSGVVDLLLVALRAVGNVRVESTVLVAERVAFVALAVALVARGGGATSVMTAYLATNVASLVIVGRAARAVFGAAPGGTAGVGPLPVLDADGRATAVATTVGALLPRVAALTVAVGGAAGAVAAVTIAQRPFDALAVLGATALSVVHPAARRSIAAGRSHEARRLVRRAGAVLVGGAAAALVSVASAPELVLRLLSGGDRYADATGVLVVAAVVVVVTVVRQSTEVLALAEDRASLVARSNALGLAIGVLVGAALVVRSGAVGAVVGQLVAESVAVAALLVGRGVGLGRREHPAVEQSIMVGSPG